MLYIALLLVNLVSNLLPVHSDCEGCSSGGTSGSYNNNANTCRDLIHNRIYACRGTWSQPGLHATGANTSSQLCNSDKNYQICGFTSEVSSLGLTETICSDSFENNEFFASTQSTNGGWTCSSSASASQDVIGCALAQSSNGVYTITTEGVVYDPPIKSCDPYVAGISTFRNGWADGHWSFTDGNDELNTVTLDDAAYGGVLCCKQDIGPTNEPTEVPTSVITSTSASISTDISTDIPSDNPSDNPSERPSMFPTNIPSDIPSYIPSNEPTNEPTSFVTSVFASIETSDAASPLNSVESSVSTSTVGETAGETVERTEGPVTFSTAVTSVLNSAVDIMVTAVEDTVGDTATAGDIAISNDKDNNNKNDSMDMLTIILIIAVGSLAVLVVCCIVLVIRAIKSKKIRDNHNDSVVVIKINEKKVANSTQTRVQTLSPSVNPNNNINMMNTGNAGTVVIYAKNSEQNNNNNNNNNTNNAINGENGVNNKHNNVNNAINDGERVTNGILEGMMGEMNIDDMEGGYDIKFSNETGNNNNNNNKYNPIPKLTSGNTVVNLDKLDLNIDESGDDGNVYSDVGDEYVTPIAKENELLEENLNNAMVAENAVMDDIIQHIDTAK